MTERGEPAGTDPRGAGRDAELVVELEAERAGTAYWRDVAAQRRAEAARVQRRPLVRAAVAIDRRTRAGQDEVAALVERTGQAGRKGAVVAAGLAARPQLGARRRALTGQLAAAAATAPPVGRSVVVIHLGAPPMLPAAGEVVALVDASAAPTAATVDDAVAAHPEATVCLVGPSARPLHDGWLGHLVAAVDGGAAMAGAMAVHPERPWRTATAHDLCIRWSGLAVELDADGAPHLLALDAGRPPDLGAPARIVALAPPSAVAVRRSAWDQLDGLDPALPYDAAITDLSIRLRGRGEIVMGVAAAAVTDDRPVTARADLDGPFPPGSPQWRALVERHGPALAATAGAPRSGAGLSIALTTATPSRKIADRSGDWHYAGLLAAALERAGHHVRLQTAAEADDAAGRACDVHLVLRGLEPVRRTPGQAHVLWVISHPEALDVAECDAADLVLVASERYAVHLRERTTSPVEVMLQATDPRHFRPEAASGARPGRVTIVANTRGAQRPAVADAIAAGLRPAVHGQGWDGLVPDELLASRYVEFEDLPRVYADAELVLNDHWETMRAWGFVSNRIFDVLACGTPVVSDPLPELEALFGSLVPTWHGPDELAAVVAELRADPEATARRTAEARARVLAHHTFDHRAAELAAHLERHRIGSAPRSTP